MSKYKWWLDFYIKINEPEAIKIIFIFVIQGRYKLALSSSSIFVCIITLLSQFLNK